MEKEQHTKDTGNTIGGIYQEFETWHVNMGDKTVHAKRMPGFFRSLKNYGQSFWLLFFFFPYVRWDGKQAILFDIENSQFRLFSVTVLAQDIWMLALLLILLAMVLFAVTSVVSRAWCGFVCFQTAWTDWFTWIENKIEGSPHARRKLDEAPWTFDKIRKRGLKHAIWMLIALFTGISFSVWFVDAYDYWARLLRFDLPLVGWVTLIAFFFGTYLLAGMLREQTCMWLCPYARIQGVMTDSQTILPTYDVKRGEPRGKLNRKLEGEAARQGDCIDCFQCVQVCPTGIDIRDGQQLGCITCGLCLDACDAIMDKVGKPRGLIRYASLDEMEGRPVKKLYQHPRTISYIVILVLALGGIVWGLTHLGSLTLKVIPERQPMYVQLSDGSIRNQYELKVLNKTDKDMYLLVKADTTLSGIVLMGAEQPLKAKPGKGSSFTIFVKAPEQSIKAEETPIRFVIQNKDNLEITAEDQAKFMAPKP